MQFDSTNWKIIKNSYILDLSSKNESRRLGDNEMAHRSRQGNPSSPSFINKNEEGPDRWQNCNPAGVT